MTRLTAIFPMLALAAALLAYFAPEPFIPLKALIPWLLGLVMLGMGLALTGADFTRVLKRPAPILLGTLMQYGLMPLFGWAVARGLGLPPELLIGVVLVGSAPGGTASNVITYLARGDVALSVTLTTVSTLLCVVATPALALAYAGASIDVPALAMVFDILKVVVVPVLLGVALNHWIGDRLTLLRDVLPAVSVFAILLIIAVIVALNADQVARMSFVVLLAVALHNAAGLASGYGLARLLGQDETTARTLAIEVGMQNSGLAVALALKHFSPAAALPGAIFSFWHNLSGSLLASHWARRAVRQPPSD